MPRRTSLQVRYLELAGIWTKTRGAGVRVAVLDSGIFTSHALPATRVHAIGANGGEQDATSDPHGTYCGSLVASEGKGAEGAAPEVEVLSIQVGVTTGVTVPSKVRAGLERALEYDCDVISCSLVLPDLGPERVKIRELTREAHLRGIPVVTAAGNDPNLTVQEFPDKLAHAIVVSAHGPDRQLLPVRYNEWTDVVSLGTGLDVVNGSGLRLVWPGLTSGATALVSGVIALALAATPARKRRRVGMAIEGLLKSTAVRTDIGEPHPFLRLNPERLVAAAAAI